MELATLSERVGRWYAFGSIRSDEKQALAEEFIRLTGDPGTRCQTCPNWWSDVQMGLINYLRAQNYPLMKSTGKYILAEGVGSLRIPFQSLMLVSTGEESEFVKVAQNPANEELIDGVLKAYPELSEHILVNPNYVAPEKKSDKPEGEPEGKPEGEPAPNESTPPVDVAVVEAPVQVVAEQTEELPIGQPFKPKKGATQSDEKPKA